MPVVLPEDYDPTWRMARIATVFLIKPGDEESVTEVNVYVRLLLYCGPFEDKDLALHVWRLFKGYQSSLPHARLCNTIITTLSTAECYFGPLGSSCWNVKCDRRNFLKLPPHLTSQIACIERRMAEGKHVDHTGLQKIGLGKAVEWVRHQDRRRRQGKMQLCAQCLFVHYCSSSCQHEDWKRHKPFCKAVKETYTDPAPAGDNFNDLKVTVGVGSVYEFCLWSHLAQGLVKDGLQVLPGLRPTQDGSARRIPRPLTSFDDARLLDAERAQATWLPGLRERFIRSAHRHSDTPFDILNRVYKR